MEIIQNDDGMQFTSNEFQEGISVCTVWLALAAPDYQETNGQVEATWWTLRTIAHSIMVHAQVSDEYTHFELLYTTDNIFPFLPIKHLVNKDGELTVPYKLAPGTKPSVSNLRVYYVHVW